MSGVFRSGKAQAILLMAFFIASLALSCDRAQARNSESSASVEKKDATAGVCHRE